MRLFKNIRTRLLLAVGTISLVVFAGVLIVDRNEKNGIDSALRERQADEAAWFERIIRLDGNSLATFAYDYSFWDDMLTFAAKMDSAWAYDNIEISLETYSADAAWVLNKSEGLHYFVTTYGCPNFDPTVLIKAMPMDRLRSDLFLHFFLSTSCGIIEIRTAPIQPSADELRKSMPQGYFIVGKFWDDKHIAHLMELTNTELKLMSVDGLVASDTTTDGDPSSGQLKSNWILADMDGRPLAVLACTSTTPFVTDIIKNANFTVYVVGGVAAALILMFWISLTVWVARPLRRVSSGLQGDDRESIKYLKKSGAEFAEIGAAIERLAQTEDALRESQRSLQTLFANLPGMAFRCANDKDWTMEMVSDGCIELTGYRPAEIVNNSVTSFADMIFADDRAAVWNEIQAGLGGQRQFHLLFRIRDRYGRLKWVEESGRGVLDGHGRLEALEGFMIDVTERVKANSQQAELQRQLDSARRMESLGLLAGGVAHDLNNMLGPLVAYPEMILESLPPDSDARELVEQLGASAEKAAAVIQDLLTLARRGRYEMRLTNLNDVIGDYLRSPHFQQLRNKSPQVNFQCFLEDEIPRINGSSAHLYKVLMNLIVNAFDAMPDGGELTIRTSAPYLHETPRGCEPVPVGQYVAVTITDTGTGIPEKDLPRIFEPYYSTKKIGSSGTGLGLAIVYGTIKDHKGALEVNSKVGQGTNFVLYFPASLDTTSATKVHKRSHHGTGTVLVVDDIQEQRTVAARLLERMGYAVKTVSSGEAAVEYLTSNPVDVAVIDMQLNTEMDGLDTFLKMRMLQSDLGAVIVSGYASTQRVQQALDAGAQAFVAKPYTRELLGQAVFDAISNRSRPIPV